MASFVLSLLCVFAALLAVNGGKPTLSDPLGLYESTEFVGKGRNYVSGSVWPKPQSESRGSTIFAVDPQGFKFSTVGQKSSVLAAALDRYMPVVFPDSHALVETKYEILETLQVKVMNKYEPMSLASDESCKY